MQQLLDSLLAEALAQPICVAPNLQEEARENLFYFGLAEVERSSVSAPALDAWLQAVVSGKRRQLRQRRGDHYPMQFYCWHDEQAAQLRFSLVAAAAPLPFGCALRLSELAAVLQEFLTQEYLVFDENLFEPDSLAGRQAAEQAAGQEVTLCVWRTVIP